MNQEAKVVLFLLAIVGICLIIFNPIWVRVAFLILFCAGLVYCVIKSRTPNNGLEFGLYLGGVVIVAILITKLLTDIAYEVEAVRIAITIVVVVASIGFFLVLFVLGMRALYKFLKKPKESID